MCIDTYCFLSTSKSIFNCNYLASRFEYQPGHTCIWFGVLMFLKWECLSHWSWYDLWVQFLVNDHGICIFYDFLVLHWQSPAGESQFMVNINDTYTDGIIRQCRKLTKWYKCRFWPSSPTIWWMIGQEKVFVMQSYPWNSVTMCAQRVMTRQNPNYILQLVYSNWIMFR